MEPYVHDAVVDMRVARDQLLAVLTEVEERDWSRYVPYGSRTLHQLLAHVASADQAWAVAARGLLKGEGEERPPAATADPSGDRERAIARRRSEPPERLLDEMERRRNLLFSLYELLEPRHLALSLRAYGEQHNSVRERIWRGYHDRLHAADVRRALRMNWHPPKLTFVPPVQPAAQALSPDATLYVIYSVDPARWEAPSPDAGWSNRNLLAHIATGDWVLQHHLREIVARGRVAEWPDVAAGNAQRVEERRFSTDAALTDEYLSMRHETMTLLARLKPKHLELEMEFWWEPSPNRHTVLDYVTMFERHDRTHREQLRPAMKYATARGGA